jgi:lipid-A-disaccharide synthase
MKYYLIAGEASGDLHASNLIKSLKKTDPDASFRCFGGDLMKDAGALVFLHYREMALMGLMEVITKLGTIRKNKNACREDILHWNPDVLILVDYSGFNLPMARFAFKNKIPVIYYISPKLWAWAQWRVKTVRRYVKRMFVILPFEVAFYNKHNVNAEYYGNPVLDSVAAFEEQEGKSEHIMAKAEIDEPVIALLAGSRKQEISALLPEMLKIIPAFPGYKFVIAGAPSISPDFYSKFMDSYKVEIVYNQTYRLLHHSTAAVVTSGTATLETALLNVPEVVVYKTSPVTLFIGRFFVKVKFFSLVNLILDKEVVRELLQENLSEDISLELKRILHDKTYRQNMLDNFGKLRKILGTPGVADKVASRIYQIMKKTEDNS